MFLKRRLINLKRNFDERYVYPHKVKGKQKIFCIGANKTGTTSLKKAFKELGFIVGNQRKAEKLLKRYKEKNFQSIIEYSKSAQVFQDFPFSFPETFKHLDEAFPGSKFILTIRSSEEQWYDSVINFHAKMFGGGKIPTKEDLQNAAYVYKGWIWECNRLIFKTPQNDCYQKDLVIKSYRDYNRSVEEYFKERPNDLLVIDISQKDSYQKTMAFLNIKSPFDNFPWKNKTRNIAVNNNRFN